MSSNKMRPRVTKQNIRNIRLFENGGSKTLIGIKDDRHALISHNLGISWKQIDRVSGSQLGIPASNEKIIVISDRGSGRLYLIDGRGNVIKEFVIELDWSALSLHPTEPNAILLESCQRVLINGVYDDVVTHYYTKDGGASELKVLNQCNLDQGYSEPPDYKFITGGMRDLIYYGDVDQGCPDYTAYALNFFSESPLEFTHFPFVVHQTQDIFYGIQDGKELHVSEDGVNFEHIKFPPQSPHSEPEKNTRSYIRWCLDRGYLDEDRSKRTKGSLFLQKDHHYGPDIWNSRQPWITLFRYDVKRKEIKVMLNYCYDFLVVSAEEGIIIANYVTNPRGCIDDKEEPRIRTVITYNDGTDWEPMTGPSGAEFSVDIFYSLERSLGDEPSNTDMMIVCGKEGQIQNYRIRDSIFHKEDTSLSTYMTKDAGRSWRKIYDEAMEWMVGGDDDIIIMGQYDQKYVLYSLDCGMTWNKLTIGMRFPSWCSKYRTSSSSHSKRFWLDSYSISFDPADHQEQSFL